ncbi:MAG: helix-turn-helix transcriptional regulator [Clostridium sp.]|nr:helix-turn-helix transcriptional regulator [Clostridium sp.]
MWKRHGLSKTKNWNVWQSMLQRCNNENCKDYYLYGARGIKVCNEWYEYINFYNWSMKNGYDEGVSIDRINTNGDYEPSNCRWITNKQQQNNKRNNIHIIYEGTFLTLTELAEKIGISRDVLEMRYIRGDRGERLVRPVRKRIA